MTAQPEMMLVLSDSTTGMDYHTPHAVHGGDGLWTVWQGYHDQREHIFARHFDGTSLSATETITPHGGLHHSPFIGLAGHTPTAVWLQGTLERSQLVSATRTEAGWGAPRRVSQRNNVLTLHAATGHDRMWAAWCQVEAPRTSSIHITSCTEQQWQHPVAVTTDAGWVQRPEVAVTEDGCWVVWDTYDGRTFSVWAAFVQPDGSVEQPRRVSTPPVASSMVTPDAWQFGPSVCVDSNGTPWVAWLCSQDVVSDDNVVDQWPTARLARLAGARWELIHDGSGSPDLAILAWGLLSWQGIGVMGYLGRRRKPLVVPDPDGGVWLLWERKEIPDGPTVRRQGILCVRRVEAEAGNQAVRIRPVRAVARGPRWYVPVGIQQGQGNDTLWVTGRVEPDISSGDVFLAEYDLTTAPLFESESRWQGWRPLALAAESRQQQPSVRPSVEITEQTSDNDPAGREKTVLHLYWADLHAHTTLSSDAEGHVDELIFYARDKAGLDCAVFSDNDDCYLRLTPSEYAAYLDYTRAFNEDGRFVLLPAFEWTYAASGVPAREGRSHRTVIAADESLPLLRYSEVEGDPMRALTEHVEQHHALLHRHHEWWISTDSPAEANIEITSGWAVHMLDLEYREQLHNTLHAGPRLGFIGSSDSHRRNPGTGGALVGIYARSLTRAGIIEALRQHRCFATDGSRIVVKLWLGETFIGSDVATGSPPAFRWEVACPVPPATVTLLRDGRPIGSWRTLAAKAAGEYRDTDCAPGQHFYYLAVEQSSPWRHFASTVAVAWGPRAWSSPIWVRRRG